MKSILIVEDDRNIQDIIAYNLEKEDFKVFTSDNGVEALELMADGEDIDLVLLDIMMPKMDGYECLRIIKEKYNIPVIMVTALEAEENIVQGLEMGADDYIVKPFRNREMVARIRANLKKDIGIVKKNDIFKLRNLTFNSDTKEVVIGDKHVMLSDVECKIFTYLILCTPDKVVSRTELKKAVWGDGDYDDRTVDVNIRRLREKIESDTNAPVYIKTSRGRGYFIDADARSIVEDSKSTDNSIENSVEGIEEDKIEN